MRVLHIDAGRELRGGQWQALYLARGLCDAGCASLLLAPADSPLFQQARTEGLDVRPLRLAGLEKLSREVDLTHAHDARAHTMAVLLARPPLVVARRVAFPVRATLVSRWKYRRAAHFIAVSECVKRELLQAAVPEEKISVIYDGVAPRGRVAGGSRVVALASEDPGKGNALIRQAAHRAGVDVFFSRNLREDLSGARLFVYVTSQEGLGSAALLAMAAGVPVVASRVGGLPEIVEHGQTGLLVENTPESIARAMRTMIEDPALAASLAGRAWQRVQERFSIARMVEDTLGVYRKVLSC